MIIYVSHPKSQGVVDPYYSDVVTLLSMDGTEGGTSLSDTSIYTWPVTRISGSTTAAQSCLGSYSMNLPAGFTIADDAVFDFGTGDFTIEMFVYVPTGARGNFIGWSIMGGGEFYLGVNASFGSVDYSTGIGSSGTVGTMPLNQCVFMVVTRASGVYTIWMNNSVIFTSSLNSGTSFNVSGVMYYGKSVSSSLTDGYFGPVRVTKRIARYTIASPPTTPTSPFPNQ